jgi:hypothetical protein
MKELEIKKILIQDLIRDLSPDFLLGSEFRFNFGSRRADIVTLDGNTACAYEIKGAGDSMDRLSYQIDSYREYFDFCYIVCERSNLSNVRNSCSKDIGIIVVSDSGIIKIRKSKEFKKMNKLCLASTIDSKTLRKSISKNKSIPKSKILLCERFVSENSLSNVKLLSRFCFRERLKLPFKSFIQEIGSVIHYEDISTLNRMPPSELYAKTQSNS